METQKARNQKESKISEYRVESTEIGGRKSVGDIGEKGKMRGDDEMNEWKSVWALIRIGCWKWE